MPAAKNADRESTASINNVEKEMIADDGEYWCGETMPPANTVR